MSATKTPSAKDTSSDGSSHVRDGRIDKSQKPTGACHSSSKAQPATSPHAKLDDARSQDEKTVYQVITEYRYTGYPDRIRVFAQHTDLAEANREASFYLNEEYGPGMKPEDWISYQEDMEANGSVRVRASGYEGGDHVVRIEKKVVKRRPKPRKEPLGYSYVVLVQYRNNVNEFNEEGDLDCVNIGSIYSSPEKANQYLRSLVDGRIEDRTDLECDERKEEGLLHMSILDIMEGEKVVYDVEKHPVW